MKTRIKQKAAALKFANQVRKALGKDPLQRLPLGIPEDPSKCSLSLAIDDKDVQAADGDLAFGENTVKAYAVLKALNYPVQLDDPFNGLELPDRVQKFVEDYDNLKYPELVDIRTLLDTYSAVTY